MLLLTACDEENSSTPPVAGCIAQKFVPTNDPNLPVDYKARYEISNTAPITSESYSEIPSKYCASESGYTGSESTLYVKNSDVLSLSYDSGNHSDGSNHKYTSSDPDFENDTLVYDVKYEGSLADTGTDYHLTTVRSGGYVYSVYEVKNEVPTIVGIFNDLDDLKDSKYSFIINSPGALTSAELNELYDDHLSF